MPNNDLEKGLRDRLYDHEEPVDTAALWQAVEQGISDVPRRKRRLIWWWLPLLIAGVTTLAGYHWLTNQQARPQGTEIVEDSTAANIEFPTNTAQITRPNTTDQRETIIPLTEQTSPDRTTSNVGNATRPSASSPDQTNDHRGDEQITTYTVKAGATPRAPSISAAPAAAPPYAITDQPAENLRALNTLVAAIPALALEDLPNTGKPLFLSPKPTPAIPFQKSVRPWQLTAAVGAALPLRNVNSVNTDRGISQRDRNLAVESPLEAVTADLLLGYRTPTGWTLRSGISYARINSRAEAIIESTNFGVAEGLTEIIFEENGETTEVFGEITTTNRIANQVRYHNHLTTIDLPLLVGKSFAAGPWRFGIEAGPVLNLFIAGSARYQQPNGNFSTRAENERLFRNHLRGLSWRASLSASYQLRPGLEVSLSLSGLRRYRSGFETEAATTRTTYDLMGGQLGLTRSF